MWRSAILLAAVTLSSCSAPAPRPVSDDSFSPLDLRDHSSLDKAVAMVARLDYNEASRKLEPLAAQYEAAGDAEHAAVATFWLGYCREKQGKMSEAGASYRKVLEKYPQTKVAPNAQERLDALSANQ